MTVIGTFTSTADGYVGHIRTLMVRRRVRFRVNEGAHHGRNPPAFRLLSGETEIGLAWKAVSRDHRPYLAVLIDDPAWPAPVRASLIESDGEARLVWKRRPGDR